MAAPDESLFCSVLSSFLIPPSLLSLFYFTFFASLFVFFMMLKWQEEALNDDDDDEPPLGKGGGQAGQPSLLYISEVNFINFKWKKKNVFFFLWFQNQTFLMLSVQKWLR